MLIYLCIIIYVLHKRALCISQSFLESIFPSSPKSTSLLQLHTKAALCLYAIFCFLTTALNVLANPCPPCLLLSPQTNAAQAGNQYMCASVNLKLMLTIYYLHQRVRKYACSSHWSLDEVTHNCKVSRKVCSDISSRSQAQQHFIMLIAKGGDCVSMCKCVLVFDWVENRGGGGGLEGLVLNL